MLIETFGILGPEKRRCLLKWLSAGSSAAIRPALAARPSATVTSGRKDLGDRVVMAPLEGALDDCALL